MWKYCLSRRTEPAPQVKLNANDATSNPEGNGCDAVGNVSKAITIGSSAAIWVRGAGIAIVVWVFVRTTIKVDVIRASDVLRCHRRCQVKFALNGTKQGRVDVDDLFDMWLYNK